MSESLSTFIYKTDFGYRWYVLMDNHVLDQGATKTAKTAESRAAKSKATFLYELAGELS